MAFEIFKIEEEIEGPLLAKVNLSRRSFVFNKKASMYMDIGMLHIHFDKNSMRIKLQSSLNGNYYLTSCDFSERKKLTAKEVIRLLGIPAGTEYLVETHSDLYDGGYAILTPTTEYWKN